MSGHGRAPNAEKGMRYLGLLDQALCNANWANVPELARKVDKHAPQHNGLTFAARTQCQIATASHRPTSASSATSTSIHGLGDLVPKLTDAVVAARKNQPDDAYIASACLAEIHWLREAPLEALAALKGTAALLAEARHTNTVLGWLEVCQVKVDFIQASCLDTSGRHVESREAYQAAARKTPGYRSPELRRWTERLLAHACMYCVKKMPSPSLHDMSEAYAAFCAWGEFWQRAPPSAGTVPAVSRLDISRKQVWASYYELLSTLLHADIVHTSSSASSLYLYGDIPTIHRSTARQYQRATFHKVEAIYETFLLADTKFPKASQTNAEAELWCEQVMRNWRVFSGSRWSNTDLGDGGKRSVSRGVLDILYRAASRTFHSTPILRHLFAVHSALGEFDLAMHAFDSYVEIVDKGKARSEKTGKREVGFDDDNTAITTAAEAIRILCRYGDREQAEKAMEIQDLIQSWLGKARLAPDRLVQMNGNTNGERLDDDSALEPHSTAPPLRPSTLAAAFRATGVAQAFWASLTYETENRSRLLTEAKDNLTRAKDFDNDSIETAHALSLVLAELRDVAGSLGLIQSVIEPKQEASETNGNSSSLPIYRQLRIIPLWHLLALCLTGEDQFEAAAQMCEASHRQFGHSELLFGSNNGLTGGARSPNEKLTSSGIVDDMESFEKESMVQIKMTQIMLLELTEGPEEATNLTDELSSLYARLFGNPEQVVAEFAAKPPPTAVSQAPSKLGGTLKSLTGSMRPRTARSTRSSQRDTNDNVSNACRDDADVPPLPDANGVPIAITITNEDGVASEKPQHHQHLPHLPFQTRGRRSSSTRSQSRVRSISRRKDVVNEKSAVAATDAATATPHSPDQPLEEVPHNAPHDQWAPPNGHEDQPPRQDIRLPAPHPASALVTPEPQMSSMHERRHKVGVLVKVWLFSASLYIRAETFDDAENLINDVTKLIESLELQLTRSEDGINARRLYHRGWGSGRSVDELWADLYSIKAELALARERPFEGMAAYEQTLAHDPHHPAGVVGLSNLLMDIYEEKLAAEEPVAILQPAAVPSNSLIAEAKPSVTRPTSASTLPSRRPSVVVAPEPIILDNAKADPSPAELNRLAARDRAYMLLSNLTKQGAGWDDSEAWYTLARAHELSGEISKAKQALWWVVELENNRPIRPWKDVSPGGYTL